MDEDTTTRRIPRDAFEAELYRRELQRACDLSRIGRPLHTSMGYEPIAPGVWRLVIGLPDRPNSNPLDIDVSALLAKAAATPTPPDRGVLTVAGECWLEEREHPATEHYRIVAMYRLPVQKGLLREWVGEAGYGPVGVHWFGE